MKSQLDWDLFYLKVADLVAQQSYAEDRKVGALIVKDGNIISFSYNGTPPNTNNDTQSNIVLHAEAQAIAKVARSNNSTVGTTLYCTLSPCIDCAKLIYSVGIKRLVFRDLYKTTDGVTFLRSMGVGINHSSPTTYLADPQWLAKSGLI
jgi:dCMP deaminase